MGIQPRRSGSRLVIAVDGGVATGKSSVCTSVAQRLRIPYFNAGLLYRALALWCVTQGLSLDNADGATVVAAGSYPVFVSFEDGNTAVTLAGYDVSDQLKTAEVSSVVPMIARHSGVREIMNTRQREIVRQAVSEYGGIVIDGRDATTVVVPDAEVKILLVVDREAQARRTDVCEGGIRAAERDAADAAVSDFLHPRSGVAVFDTSAIDLDELVAQVLAYVFTRHPWW
ncbi:d(CMP) kinase [Nocardia sp. BMG111209]|uniref:(d)CMP kinase n=1 Tax=Nocardia sp. BMG111209 TaxID=1160137 RepID=UPI0018CB633C|nr:(d)CMP kinase [Nocardia sp. BMG111209]